MSLVLGVTGEDDLDDVPMWLYALAQTSQWLGLVGIPVLAARTKGNGLLSDFGATMQWRDVPTGLAIGIALQLVAVPLISWPWLELLDRSGDDLEERARDLTDRAHGFGLVMLVLVVVIGAPLAEELFFRGLALRAIERRAGVVAAVILSSVVFASTHFDLLSFPALVVFGAVMAVLVVRSGRLGPAVWAHVGFNATTIVLLLMDR